LHLGPKCTIVAADTDRPEIAHTFHMKGRVSRV
jgi:hypothetical protein